MFQRVSTFDRVSIEVEKSFVKMRHSIILKILVILLIRHVNHLIGALGACMDFCPDMPHPESDCFHLRLEVGVQFLSDEFNP